MPIISEFQGIRIYMYWDDHNPPHIHAEYDGKEVLKAFDGKVLSGKLPAKKDKLVDAWLILREDEVKNSWELAKDLKPLPKIAPLS